MSDGLTYDELLSLLRGEMRLRRDMEAEIELKAAAIDRLNDEAYRLRRQLALSEATPPEEQR